MMFLNNISALVKSSERFNLTTFFVIIDDTGTDFFITYFFNDINLLNKKK